MHSDAYFGMKLGWKYELIPDGRLSSVTTHWPFKSIVCSVARAVSTVIMTRNNNFLEKEYISQRELMLLGYFCPIFILSNFPRDKTSAGIFKSCDTIRKWKYRDKLCLSLFDTYVYWSATKLQNKILYLERCCAYRNNCSFCYEINRTIVFISIKLKVCSTDMTDWK